jgi:hypothetical protein
LAALDFQSYTERARGFAVTRPLAISADLRLPLPLLKAARLIGGRRRFLLLSLVTVLDEWRLPPLVAVIFR